MRRRSRGLVARLVLVVVLAGAVAAGVGAFLLSTAARSGLRTEVVERSGLVAQELATRLDSRVANARDTLRLVAADPGVAELSPASAARLRAALRTSSVYDELLLFDRDGTPVAAAANAFAAELVDHPERADIADAASRSEYVGLLDTFPPMLELAVPVENPPGNAVGFLLARLPLEVLALPVQQPDTRSGATSFLVDATGRILVHPERDRIAAAERFPLDELGGGTGAGTLEVDGERLIAAAAPLGSFGGAVVLAENESLALRPVARRLIELVGILVAVLAATMLAVILAGGRLLRPLGQLVDAVNRLGRGERGVRAGVRGAGEVAQLSREFDRMSETLDRRDAQLDELQRLALLVNASLDRDGLADDLARGAQSLLQADACAFVSADDAAAITSVGQAFDDATLRRLADGANDGQPRVADFGDGYALSVPVTTLSGAALGGLVALRHEGRFTAEERALATAFASFAGVAMDNARRLQLEQALVHELQESVERRRMLIGGVTHEFRTPLTCIEGFSAELLERWEQLPDEEREILLRKIHGHATELDRLVSQLLEFAATERGRTSPTLSVVQLASLVEQELRALGPLLDGRPLHVAVPDVEVLADAQLLRGVLDNLVSNAVKYSPPGAAVAVSAEEQGRFVRVGVADEGIGMSPDEVELAFQPFWRAPGVRSERGTGLGLALVAEYVRAMNGTLSVTSEPGKGSVFSFTLRRRVRQEDG